MVEALLVHRFIQCVGLFIISQPKEMQRRGWSILVGIVLLQMASFYLEIYLKFALYQITFKRMVILLVSIENFSSSSED